MRRWFLVARSYIVSYRVLYCVTASRTQQMRAQLWTHDDDSRCFELMWVQLMNSTVAHTLVGAIYHPPKPKYRPNTLLDFIVANVTAIRGEFPSALVVLAGDFNRLAGDEIAARCWLRQIVQRPTRGARILDKIYVSRLCYSHVDVVQPSVNSDHNAVVAYNVDRHNTAAAAAAAAGASRSLQPKVNHRQ